jgi:diguanylate cyclase (GGDEF)-like protein
VENGDRLLQLAALAADHVGRVLALSDQYERVESLALLDSLTRLYNRRFLDGYLVAEVSRAGRDGQPLTLAMLDLDGFKRVNDTYGHVAGDQVLREVAHLLRASVRRQEVLVRYGGDEFAVIMSGSGRMASEAVLERVQRTFDNHRFRVGNDQADLTVRLSFGLATYPLDALTAEELLAAADRALYRSKRGVPPPPEAVTP